MSRNNYIDRVSGTVETTGATLDACRLAADVLISAFIGERSWQTREVATPMGRQFDGTYAAWELVTHWELPA